MHGAITLGYIHLDIGHTRMAFGIPCDVYTYSGLCATSLGVALTCVVLTSTAEYTAQLRYLATVGYMLEQHVVYVIVMSLLLFISFELYIPVLHAANLMKYN